MKNWQTFSMKSALVLITLSAVFMMWQVHEYEHGTIDRWIDAVLLDLKSNPITDDFQSEHVVACQADISETEQIHLLMKSLRWLETPERRNCVLKIIAEQFPEEAHDLFVSIGEKNEHELLVRNSILLTSLFREEKDAWHFEKFLDHESGLIRSAAVDALGVLRKPSFPMPAGFDHSGTWQDEDDGFFLSNPRIKLEPIARLIAPKSKRYGKLVWKDQTDRKLPSNIKTKIKQMLLSDLDPKVRSAAARAAKDWIPDDYKLRVAEWGVWINEGENLILANSIIDEIPPFVHQAGDDIASITQGRTNTLIITKPILHFSVDRPMVVDVSVRIKAGRPWFGFPMPDDFATADNTPWTPRPPQDVPADLDLKPLKEAREGYPWLGPSHTKRDEFTLREIGFRWQTLFVSPEKLDWMTLKPITDPKYAWWSRLRKVKTSWVSNRGESERFLYYDGPTEYPSPVVASLDSGQLKVAIPDDFFIDQSRSYFFIEVSDGELSAVVKTKTFSGNYPRSTEFAISDPQFQGVEVEKQLVEILVEKGISADEAMGLVDCWRPQFFQTDGQRLLTIFGKKEYDELCRISIFPPPTELSRVGIVLTEFSDKGKSGK